MFEMVPCFVRLVGKFPRPDFVFDDALPVEDNEVKVYCLTLSKICFSRSCVFNQVVDGFEDDVNWLGRILDH